jgi:hypothetical protein
MRASGIAHALRLPDDVFPRGPCAAWGCAPGPQGAHPAGSDPRRLTALRAQLAAGGAQPPLQTAAGPPEAAAGASHGAGEGCGARGSYAGLKAALGPAYQATWAALRADPQGLFARWLPKAPGEQDFGVGA